MTNISRAPAGNPQRSPIFMACTGLLIAFLATAPAMAATSLKLVTHTMNAEAGVEFDATITALNNNGTIDAAYEGDKTITFSGVQPSPNNTEPTSRDKNQATISFGKPVTLNFAAGQADTKIILYTAGNQTIVVGEGSISSAGDITDDPRVTISGAAPADMYFSVQPSDANAGKPIIPAPSVELVDVFGNHSGQAYDLQLMISIQAGTGMAGAELSGTVERDTNSGIAIFNEISIDLANISPEGAVVGDSYILEVTVTDQASPLLGHSFASGTFEIHSQFTVLLHAGPNGSLSTNDSLSKIISQVVYDQSSEVTAIPDFGYHFTNWILNSGEGNGTFNPADNPLVITEVTGDMTATANFALNQYTVSFDLDGKGAHGGGGALDQQIMHGANAVAPIVNANPGWIFTGWSASLENITSDQAITALYTRVTYTVSFNLDGKAERSGGGELTQAVTHGENATAPTVAANAGWAFTGWSASLENITADQTITAQYVQTYTVTFDLDDKAERTGGGALVQVVNHGAAATAPTLTADPGWQFVGWEPALPGTITADITLVADFDFELVLLPGWNLVSLPIAPEIPTVADIFDAANLVSGRDGGRAPVITGPAWGWNGWSYRPVDELEALAGVWVYAEDDAVLLVQGDRVADPAVNLRRGWNLVGATHDMPAPQDPRLHAGGFWGYDPETDEAFMEDELLPGWGYWLNATRAFTLPMAETR